MMVLSDTLMYIRYFQKNCYLSYLKNRRGLDFTGRIESTNQSFRGYEGCYSVKSIMRKMNITNNDKILDIGCGKGLFLYYSTKYNFGRIDGVEYSKELVNIARSNAKTINDRRINIYNCDAQYFMHYDQYNYFFINNPFSAEIMEKVVLSLVNSYFKNRRKMIVLYQFPFSKIVFENNGFNVLYEKYPNSILTFG